MAKFHGAIGYVQTTETAPGVYSEDLSERIYYGDIIRNTKRLENNGQLNDNLNVNNLFSIIGDDWVYQNFQTIRYIRWAGALWKVTNIEIQRPRLILTIGGVYNAP